MSVGVGVVLLVLIVIALAGVLGSRLPSGFVPEEDQGFILVNGILPDASSLEPRYIKEFFLARHHQRG